MKRKLAWLALPLLLCVLVWGVKWRADHPVPTKTDLEIRALMSKCSTIEVFYTNRKLALRNSAWLSHQESQHLINHFYLTTQQNTMNAVQRGSSETVDIFYVLARPREDGVVGVIVSISVDKREGGAVIVHPHQTMALNLHPVTAKRWIDLLFSHPRFGPQLKAELRR